MKKTFAVFFLCSLQMAFGQNLYQKVDKLSREIEGQVINWRRDFHQFPELSNREFKTSEKIYNYLISLGLNVQKNVAKTGVVAVLKGAKKGPTVALRADIDALPITETGDLPFISKQKSEYNGKEVGVMHACGHDTHAAMLLGAATVLSKMKSEINGSVVFIFQPAEEGAPEGERGGAELMVDEGVLVKNTVDVIFALHINSLTEVGKIEYKPRGTMAAADEFKIIVKGKASHGSTPWRGVDPITVSAQIIMGLQTIISRQSDLTNEAAVISIGKIEGGVRNNIIPEKVEMIGSIRTLDEDMQTKIHQKIKQTAELIAQSAGATAEVIINKYYPITFNNPELTAKMLSSLYKTAGEENVLLSKPLLASEDFSFFAMKVPGLYLNLGGRPKNISAQDAPPHHSPSFAIDESSMLLGVKTLCNLTLDYINTTKAK